VFAFFQDAEFAHNQTAMKQPRIPPDDSKLNSMPAGFGRAAREVGSAIQAALSKKHWPMLPPIKPKNGSAGPPKEPEPGKDAAFPAQQVQLEDSSQPVTDVLENRNSPPPPLESLRVALLSKPFTDLIGDAALEALPELQQRLLDEGVISEPILAALGPVAFPEEVTPQATIGCKIQQRLAFHSEPKGQPASACFDRDPSGEFCRLQVVSLNVDNPAAHACLEKRNVAGIQFFAAVAIAKCLSRDPSPLAQTLLAEVKTLCGLAPNSRLSTAGFARAVARSPLLASIEELPILHRSFAELAGRSFRLGEISLAIPVRDLGRPWDRKST
jgi:hypothetical protein